MSDYKFIKQKLLAKLSKKDKFNKIKDSFFENKISNKDENKSNKHPQINSTQKNNIIYQNELQNNNEKDIKFYDGDNVINTFKKQETDSLIQTRKMIYELSDLVTNFSSKVYEQQEITNMSKIEF